MNASIQTPTYPVVQFLVSRGKAISWVLSALVLLGALGFSLASASPWPLAIGVAAAVVLLGLLLSYVEVLRIIADTLLPKY